MKPQKNNKNKQIEIQVEHRPFLIRKCIFFPSFAAGLLASHFLENYALGLSVYFLVATISDVIAQYALKLRASDFSDPKRLLEHEQTTPQKLDRYYMSRCNIRVLSLAFAGLSQFLMFSPVLFCVVFVGVTFVSRVYAWYQLDIEAPKSIHIIQQSPRFGKKISSFDLIQPQRSYWENNESAEIAAGFAGVGKYSYLSGQDNTYNHLP